MATLRPHPSPRATSVQEEKVAEAEGDVFKKRRMLREVERKKQYLANLLLKHATSLEGGPLDPPCHIPTPSPGFCIPYGKSYGACSVNTAYMTCYPILYVKANHHYSISMMK